MASSQTLTVQLADRKKLDSDVWNKLNSGSDVNAPVEGMASWVTAAAVMRLFLAASTCLLWATAR